MLELGVFSAMGGILPSIKEAEFLGVRSTFTHTHVYVIFFLIKGAIGQVWETLVHILIPVRNQESKTNVINTPIESGRKMINSQYLYQIRRKPDQ